MKTFLKTVIGSSTVFLRLRFDGSVKRIGDNESDKSELEEYSFVDKSSRIFTGLCVDGKNATFFWNYNAKNDKNQTALEATGIKSDRSALLFYDLSDEEDRAEFFKRRFAGLTIEGDALTKIKRSTDNAALELLKDNFSSNFTHSAEVQRVLSDKIMRRVTLHILEKLLEKIATRDPKPLVLVGQGGAKKYLYATLALLPLELANWIPFIDNLHFESRGANIANKQEEFPIAKFEFASVDFDEPAVGAAGQNEQGNQSASEGAPDSSPKRPSFYPGFQVGDVDEIDILEYEDHVKDSKYVSPYVRSLHDFFDYLSKSNASDDAAQKRSESEKATKEQKKQESEKTPTDYFSWKWRQADEKSNDYNGEGAGSSAVENASAQNDGNVDDPQKISEIGLNDINYDGLIDKSADNPLSELPASQRGEVDFTPQGHTPKANAEKTQNDKCVECEGITLTSQSSTQNDKGGYTVQSLDDYGLVYLVRTKKLLVWQKELGNIASTIDNVEQLLKWKRVFDKYGLFNSENFSVLRFYRDQLLIALKEGKYASCPLKIRSLGDIDDIDEFVKAFDSKFANGNATLKGLIRLDELHKIRNKYAKETKKKEIANSFDSLWERAERICLYTEKQEKKKKTNKNKESQKLAERDKRLREDTNEQSQMSSAKLKKRESFFGFMSALLTIFAMVAVIMTGFDQMTWWSRLFGLLPTLHVAFDYLLHLMALVPILMMFFYYWSDMSRANHNIRLQYKYAATHSCVRSWLIALSYIGSRELLFFVLNLLLIGG